MVGFKATARASAYLGWIRGWVFVGGGGVCVCVCVCVWGGVGVCVCV